MFKLFPREGLFFELIQQATENGRLAAQKLVDMMQNYQNPSEQAQAIKDLEHQGDTLTHKLLRHVDQTFVTPIDREDIHALASAIDDVVDLVEAVADRMVVFKIERPTEEAQNLARLIYRSTEEIAKSAAALRGRVNGTIYTHCVEINRLENEADRVHRDAIAKLFETERDPIKVIKWKEIYEFLEEATDCCEDVADVLESIALKYT